MPRPRRRPPPDLSPDERRDALDALRDAMLAPTPYRALLLSAVAGADVACRNHLLVRLGAAGLECKRAAESDAAWRPWDGQEI